jgi:hypothetical protein
MPPRQPLQPPRPPQPPRRLRRLRRSGLATLAKFCEQNVTRLVRGQRRVAEVAGGNAPNKCVRRPVVRQRFVSCRECMDSSIALCRRLNSRNGFRTSARSERKLPRQGHRAKLDSAGA